MNHFTHCTECLSRGVQRGSLVLALVWLLAGLLCLPPAQAQTATSYKVAADLQQGINAATTPKLNWAKDINGVRFVKALVVSNSDDADLVALRSAVMATGGSVYYRFLAVRAIAVLLPATSVYSIAARGDVIGISPNRVAASSASTLEASSGALNHRSYTGSGYSGLDGSGVGIAVLDSGIMWNHRNMLDAAGVSRVTRSIDLLKVGDGSWTGALDWTRGIDTSVGLYPGSLMLAVLEGLVANQTMDNVDPYGHGSHVAGVAAGRGAYQAIDSSGIAPGARLFDIRVLNGRGLGQLSDVLAGIDWVVYHEIGRAHV